MSTPPGPLLGSETSIEKLREALVRVHDASRQADTEMREWVGRYQQTKKMFEAAKAVLKRPGVPVPEAPRTVMPARAVARAEPASHPDPKSTPFCTGCGKALRPGASFCSGCGRKTPARARQPKVCPQCGTAAQEGARFCAGCGANLFQRPPTRAADEAGVLAPAAASSGEHALDVTPQRTSLDWDQEPPPPPPPSQGEHPYREREHMSAGESEGGVAHDHALERSQPAARAGTHAELAPAVEPWPFRIKTTEMAQRVLAGASHVGTGPVDQNLFRRVVRATLLDTDVYREVARDPALQFESWQVGLLVIVAGSAGAQILTLQFFSLPQILVLVSTAAVHLAAWLARVWVIQYAAATWYDRKLEFSPLFRALAYAQGPVALTLLPVVGPLLALWALVTSTAAVQDVAACDTKTAVILTAIGAIGVVAAIAMAGPLVRMFL